MEPPEPRESLQVRRIPSRKASEVALSDPLKEVTRKERVYLLGLSAVGITIANTGLVPQEITTLGIKFAEADRQTLLVIFALVILYFLAAFIVYGLSDLLAFLYSYSAANWDETASEETSSEEGVPEIKAVKIRAYDRAQLLSPSVAIVRAFFEFALPLCVGLYAIWALISA